MSEKRFELVEAIYDEIGKQQIEIIDNLEKQIVDKQKIADLLNELAEENKEQADTIKHLEEYCGDLEHDNKTLSEENEELKQRIAFFEQQEMRMEYSQKIINLLDSLYEENRQLKKELYVVETDCKNAKESRNHYREENGELKDDVYDELKEALKILEEIYEDYPKNNVHHLHSRLKGLLEEFR